ncbi:MAG: hypothetical protein IH987_19705, partial [Planctomycetes bacterium]|nr:hypothetical protein [Planctomycetota bacterium]
DDELEDARCKVKLPQRVNRRDLNWALSAECDFQTRTNPCTRPGSKGDCQPYRERIFVARDRTTAWNRCEQALEERDDFGTTDLARDPLLEGYPPLCKRQEEIEAASQRSSVARELLRILQANNDPQRFVECFHVEPVRRYTEQFARWNDRLRAWVQEHVLRVHRPRENPQFKLPRLLTPKMARVSWLWPEAGKISHCVVGAKWGRRPSGIGDCDTKDKVLHADFIRENSTFDLPLPNTGVELYISVWPVVELPLGEPVCCTQALEFDAVRSSQRVPPRRKKGRKRSWSERVGAMFDL